MTTILNYNQNNDSLSKNMKINNNSSEILSVKLSSFDQEPMTSPNSTEYTDSALSEAASDLKRSNSNSPRYCVESPSFDNVSYENKAMIQEAGSPQSSKDMVSNEENEEEEEEEMSEDLKDWNEKRDKVLKNLASKCKYDWKKIAKKFNSAENTQITPLDLKKKYKDLTKVSIPLRVKFSHQEDLMIAKYFEMYGCDWARIATFFTDRTAMMLKNRYYSHIRKKNLLASMLEEVRDGVEGTDFVPEEVSIKLEPQAVKMEFTPVKIESIEVKVESAATACKMESEEEEEAESPMIKYEQEDSYFFSDFMSYPYRRFAMSAFNPMFYEFENAIPNVLHDRITHSNW